MNQVANYDEVAYIFPASQALAEGIPSVACPGPVTLEGPIGQYVARMGEGWDGPGQGSADLAFSYVELTQQVPADVLHKTFELALAEWSRHVQINFRFSEDPYAPGTLSVLFAHGAHGDPYPFDGPSGVLGHTFYPAPLNPEPIAGDLHFDDDENWNSVDYFSVVLHELGHALGLGHSDQPGAVMYPYYHRATELNQEDIDAIQTLYAARKATSPADPGPPAEPPPPSTPAIPSTPVVPSTPATPAAPATPAPPTTPATPSAPSTPPTPSNPATPSGDSTAPSLTITFPFNASVGTSNSTIGLRGTSRDDTGVAEVSWSANDGQSGIAQGTTFWSIPSVKLRIGATVVTVRARDQAGNTSWRSVSVTRN
ncbi:MAG: matrixin family metalloprotease [Acidobacteria bacterium]|nr:matrixin family metalloprotease [Acidobacteriota bacterium]